MFFFFLKFVKNDSYFYLRNDYIIGTIFLQTASISHTHNIARVHDISYSRTAIDLRVAIYELERALHDRRRNVNIIFLRKEAWERS